MPRPPADTDTTKRVNILGIPGLESQPFDVNFRLEGKTQRDRNLKCNSTEAAQINALTGCNGQFLSPNFDSKAAIKANWQLGDRGRVNIDYDQQREFDASNAFSLYYEGLAGAKLQRVDLGNISFAPPTSRYITASLPSGNYGLQIVNQFGNFKLKSIFARQTGNVVLRREYTIGARSEQRNTRDLEDRQMEPRRFFFTVDPILFGRAYPNIDILNRSQLASLRNALPDTLRPSRVMLYRLQFGAQPQNPNGPRFRIQGDSTQANNVYDLLREGVDYTLDPSGLWFALVRPLNEASERLVIAYNVRLNGRDTVHPSTGGTPDVELVTSRPQIANLIWEPNLAPSAPAFRNEIRSVYRIAGEELVRSKTQVRVVTGGGLLERPFAGGDATFLHMFGLDQSTNPAEFDFNNRLWPRASDPVFNLGTGAIDVRNGQSLGIGRIVRDNFLVFPSLRPFAERPGGLVVSGNPTNDALYTTPGEYLSSPQRPASVYRLNLRYETTGPDENAESLTLGAAQMRQGSDRVTMDGRPLVRERDYRIDYDVGRIDFIRPDTLFRQERRLEVSFEENPSFAPAPTTLAGFVSELPVRNGVFNFTAINQSQSTVVNRPQFGFQGASSLMTGVSGQFSWNAPALSRLVSRLPFGDTKTESHISVQGEIASSHPQFGARNQGQVYVDDFQGGGGTNIPLADIAWEYSSLPAYGRSLAGRFGAGFFEVSRASTLVWQANAQAIGGAVAVFKRSQIDPLTNLFGTGIELNEPVLWLTLLPLTQLGQYNQSARRYDWTTNNALPGPRFRSIRTALSPAGIDLTKGEQLEFWALLDTTFVGRSKNPALIFDFGDVSENSLAFSPETLTIARRTDGTVDSLNSRYSGKRPQGFDRLDTERDSFSRAFNFEVNDKGLPGDVADTLVVIDGALVRREFKVPICRGQIGRLLALGDPSANCTVANSRLDEEDIDQDNVLNFPSTRRESERLLRYVVDLSKPTYYKRGGGFYKDTLIVRGVPQARTRQWMLISIPFQTPTDSLNEITRRKIRALRLTVVSGLGQDDAEATQLPLADLRVTGAPWLNRSNVTLAGVGGTRPGGGFVITSTIGTNDSSAALVYQPPPGVADQPEFKGAQIGGLATAINERSMRIQAGNLPLYHRAEAFFRFPAGPQFYLGFQQFRVWGRGRGNGWGPSGDLQMFVKVGRDENNFYLYRAPMDAGSTSAAWTDLSIDFDRFINLRKKLQADYLAGKKESIACTGADSAIVVASALPVGVVSHRFAACDNGYMVYTVDPAVTAPNLAAVQELAVGIVRVGAAGGASSILPNDTLELWVDDVRLDRPVNNSGMAGQVSLEMNLGGLADFRVSFANKDPNFRQVGEQPTFLSDRNVNFFGTINLERFLPRGVGFALPLTVNRVSVANDPLYLSQTDISGPGIAGLRKPRNDLTTYSLSIRRSAPIDGGILGPLINNLSATSSYVSGVDRTEYQDGNARNFSFGVDYLVTDDSAHTMHLPSWFDGALGALPTLLQAGPVSALRGTGFRWNPTQLRINTGFARASDRRLSFIKPGGAIDDQPAVSDASSRSWRSGSVLELRPTNALTARWEVQSVRDLRAYGDTSALAAVATRERRNLFGANAGFERERSLFTSLSWAPRFSSWVLPRSDFGTQYSMLRDPNVRSLVPLPGVIVVDSVLATRDSLAAASSFTLPRRMTAAQTASVGTMIDLAKAFTAYSHDSSAIRRVGGLFAPVDVSYTRSLLATLDAAPVGAPLGLQLGFGGPGSFRTVSGVPASMAGQTGTFSAAGALLLPFGTSFVNRFSRTTTTNWIARPDLSQAQVGGAQRQFPDVALRWAYQPATLTTAIANLDASAGYAHSDVHVSLPSLFEDIAPELRHTQQETFPVAGAITWAGRSSMRTSAKFSLIRRTDSLPGSIARGRGTELSVDAGRTFFIPASWQLGIHDDLRTRLTFRQSHNTTSIFDPGGALRARLQDNGRQELSLTADSNVNEFVVLSLHGSQIVTFDNNLNRRFSYSVVSIVCQVQFSQAGK